MAKIDKETSISMALVASLLLIVWLLATEVAGYRAMVESNEQRITELEQKP